MSDVVCRSQVRIERVKGPLRRAYLPSESQPAIFGVHGAVAAHYKASPGASEPYATTLDYVVAERVHGVFAKFCPVYRSLHAAIAITTELVFI